MPARRTPSNLPVGLTLSRSRNAGTAGIEIVGFNCAACHVGELTYQGKHVRIDGAPGMVNLQGYQMEFKDSLDATLKSPAKLLALVVAIEKQRNAADTPSGGDTSQYAGEPALQGAGNVPAAPNADPSFHSISSAAADGAQPTGAGHLPRAPQERCRPSESSPRLSPERKTHRGRNRARPRPRRCVRRRAQLTVPAVRDENAIAR